MDNKGLFDNFTNQYQVSKTLRFELKPQGKTAETIKAKGFLDRDYKRAEDYKRAKKLIDEYHKDFIEKALSDKKLSSLEQYYEEYTSLMSKPIGERDSKKFAGINDAMRKEIGEWLKDNPLKDEKKLIQEIVPEFLRNQGRDEDAEVLLSFKGFTTYFKGFNENRENIYTNKEQSTAIAYRIVDENLPRFVANLYTFNDRLRNHQIDFSEVESLIETEFSGAKLEDVFTIAYFNYCLTQKGIDRYNAVIGGKTDFNGKKIQGINEKINLFRQREKLSPKQAPLLTVLYKQILSDRVSLSFLPEKFKSANELVAAIRDFYSEGINGFIKDGQKSNVMDEIENLFAKKLNPNDCDLSKVHLQSSFLTVLSHQLFGDFSVIKDALNAYIESTFKTKKEKEKQNKRRYYTIEEIEAALKQYVQDTEIDNKQKTKEILDQANPIIYYLNALVNNVEIDGKKQKVNIIAHFRSLQENIHNVLDKDYRSNSELLSDKGHIAAIKNYLDSYNVVLHFIKALSVPSVADKEMDLVEKDALYAEFEELLSQLQLVVPLYNKVRNFITQKPYSVEKYKLNFDNVTLLDGWDVNKESDNTCVILCKDSCYYLAIMDKKHSSIFRDIKSTADDVECYEKMFYKLLPGPNKMLPKVFFSSSRIEEFAPSAELLNKYKAGTHKKGDNFLLSDCHALIDFFKSSIAKHEDWKQFNFDFSPTSAYRDISDFYKEVAHQGYKITFNRVSAKYVDQLVAEGKLYLFQIYNKDFSAYSKGKPSLYTLYWKAVFDPENLQDVVVKLNGEAEVFFRQASIPEGLKTVHPENIPIDNKSPYNPKKQSVFKYKIIKDKRYTEDKFAFHVPITLNFKAGDEYKFNDRVKQAIGELPVDDLRIIGIDRGERHLAYYSLINSKGEILKQDSFNIIENEVKGAKYRTDYHASLVAREEERDKNRKSWGAIETIKELKEGYLSQVVHKIAKLMIEHNAVVALEDLNFGFKRGRMKVERQVYQKLEKMLIDKLNYLVFKDREHRNKGGILNAYQLANKFDSFKAIGKQTGFLFYVPAANTSKIDFATGFVNLLYPKYENEKQAKDFFSKFKGIKYNSGKDYFEFKIDYNSVRTNGAESLKNSIWTICTIGKERFQYYPTTKEYKSVDVTTEIKSLLSNKGIEFEIGKDIQDSIVNLGDTKLYKNLVFYLKLVLQMRYTDGQGRDFILSPVANADGNFFCSEKALNAEPKDADANGAYHIALKGLLLMHKIKNGESKLAISNKEWYDFVQDKAYKSK